MKQWIRSMAVVLTRGQLINYASWFYGVPGNFPDKGPGRALRVEPDDRFIVSYPRSGNTWMRFLVANLVFSGETADYARIEHLVPDIYTTSEIRLRAISRPRFLKSHEPFDPRYRKVLYLVRNPVDVVISQYRTMRRAHPSFRSTFPEFVADQIAGKYDGWFGAWDEHVQSWVHHPGQGDLFLMVRYEDLRSNTETTLAQVAQFFAIPANHDQIRQAIERSSRTAMTALYQRTGHILEKTIGRFSARFLMPTDENRTLDDIGEQDILPILTRYHETMQALGYDVSRAPQGIGP